MSVTPLHGTTGKWDADPFVARVACSWDRPRAVREVEVLVSREPLHSENLTGFRAVLSLCPAEHISGCGGAVPVAPLDSRLAYLAAGDVVRVNPRRGELSVLFRHASEHNSICVTERCSNNCIMCAQPPRDRDDAFLIREWLEAIPLISRDVCELGVTGGEPTLLGTQFVDLIRMLKNWLPSTRIQVLSNGRLFRYGSFAGAVANVQHPDLTIAVPLFADVSDIHDYIVQRAGAFDETIRGLLNLARYTIQAELRVVIQQANAARLVALARFVRLNLPFVRQVSLMALEPTGFAKKNESAVWIDPYDYRDSLAEAAYDLARANLNPVVMNHPLCVLEPSVRRFAVKSISDYKNIFVDECVGCQAQPQCAGLFASAVSRHSSHITPVQ